MKNIYILRGFEVTSFFGQDSNWFSYPMHFFAFFSDFLKNVANVHKWLHVCTKIDFQTFLLKNFITHTLEILFTTYWDNSCIFTTAVKLFVAEIHTKTSTFTFSCVHCKIHRSFLKFCDSVNMIDIDMKICRILL